MKRPLSQNRLWRHIRRNVKALQLVASAVTARRMRAAEAEAPGAPQTTAPRHLPGSRLALGANGRAAAGVMPLGATRGRVSVPPAVAVAMPPAV